MKALINQYLIDNRNDYIDQIGIYTNLAENNSFNTGDKTVILASSSTGDGGGFSIGEHMYGKYVSQYLKTSSKIHETFSINPHNISIILKATEDDLYEVLRDRAVENIILVGHASYDSWVSRSGLVDSYAISEQATDHLKKGFFINTGCALINPNTFFPLGSFCMKDWKKLIGARRGWKMGFDDIKKHRFYKHPVFIHEYFTYYDMMLDDILDQIKIEHRTMDSINDYCKQLSEGIPKTDMKRA